MYMNIVIHFHFFDLLFIWCIMQLQIILVFGIPRRITQIFQGFILWGKCRSDQCGRDTFDDFGFGFGLGRGFGGRLDARRCVEGDDCGNGGGNSGGNVGHFFEKDV